VISYFGNDSSQAIDCADRKIFQRRVCQRIETSRSRVESLSALLHSTFVTPPHVAHIVALLACIGSGEQRRSANADRVW